MRNRIILILIMSALFACTSPLDKKFDPETMEADLAEIKSELDSSELMLLATGMMRLQISGKQLQEYTYNQILEDTRKWKKEQAAQEAEQKALAENAKKEEQERIKKLRESVSVSCFYKSFEEINYQKYISYKFVIQNKTDRAVRAVKGSITFTNLFDDEIKSFSFVYDKSIPAGDKVTWNAQTDYNRFLDDDVTLKNKDLDDVKVVWNPEKIMFVDGETLE